MSIEIPSQSNAFQITIIRKSFQSTALFYHFWGNLKMGLWQTQQLRQRSAVNGDHLPGTDDSEWKRS